MPLTRAQGGQGMTSLGEHEHRQGNVLDRPGRSRTHCPRHRATALAEVGARTAADLLAIGELVLASFLARE